MRVTWCLVCLFGEEAQKKPLRSGIPAQPRRLGSARIAENKVCVVFAEVVAEKILRMMIFATTLSRRRKISDICIIWDNASNHIAVSTFHFTYLGRDRRTKSRVYNGWIGWHGTFSDPCGEYGSVNTISRCSNDWW